MSLVDYDESGFSKEPQEPRETVVHMYAKPTNITINARSECGSGPRGKYWGQM